MITNIITIGVVVCILIFYRVADKNNRSLEKVKKYTEKCKEEIASFADEKSMAVKNFGIDLEVEKKAAAQLMKNIQKLTEEELAKKSQAINKIEEHISAFETSLNELFGMTDRVQENLNRIKDESVFVENTGRRVSEAKEKFEQIEKALEAAERSLEETEDRLEKKNAESMEQATKNTLAGVKSIVSDFEATARVLERKVEEHREAVNKVEREREAVLNHDIEQIKKIFKDALENAGKRADKIEEAALLKLREQAMERVNVIKSFFEDKLKLSQDTLKTEQGSINEKLKVIHDKLNAEILDLSTKQKTYHQEWVKGAAELDSLSKKQREDIAASLARQQEEVTNALIKERDTINASLVQQQNDWKQNFLELKKAADKQHKELDVVLLTSKQELNAAITDLKTKSQLALKEQSDELDTAIRQNQKEISASLTELKEKSGAALKTQQQETNEIVSKLNTSLSELQAQAKNLQHHQNEELASILKDVKEKTDSAISHHQVELAAMLKDLKEKNISSVNLHQNELAALLKDLKEKNSSTVNLHQHELSAVIKEFKEKSDHAISSQQENLNAALHKQMEEWKHLCTDTERDIISANEKRLEDYSRSHNEAFKQLTNLADDAAKMEKELRIFMQNSAAKVKNELAEFEKESAAKRDATAAEFNAQSKALRKELEEMDKQLEGLRKQAHDNVSEKLTAFEKGFATELVKRNSEISKQISEWQSGLEKRVEGVTEKVTNEWKKAEEHITTEGKKNISALDDRLTSNIEKLKQEEAAFEESIRKNIINIEENYSSFNEKIKKDLEEVRTAAENEIKVQVSQHHISMQETIKQKQKELEKEIETISENFKAAYSALEETARQEKQLMDERQEQTNTKIREMDESLEDFRRRSRETEKENEDRIAAFRQSVEEISNELSVQKKIFDQTGALKKELNKKIEEMNDDLDKLEQRKNEITQLEGKLAGVRRTEDEINNKMTRFLNEQHRIDQMEKDFNNLIKTEQSVKEKLSLVQSSDDVLSAELVKIRKLEDAIKETDDKFKRIEKKNEVLEQTNESIERNFKDLQKTETAIKSADKIITSISNQFDALRTSIELLASQNEKASDAVDKIASLDEGLAEIEKRINEMNTAREWLARTETEIQALGKDAKSMLKITKGIVEKEKGKPSRNESFITPQDREDILRLKGQGWSTEEIAQATKRSRSEVELILEVASRGA